MRKYNIYLASSLDQDKRNDMYTVIDILRKLGHNVYAPVEHKIQNAWDYPNNEWGLMVFSNDIEAINNAQIVVMLSYGRNSTAGANWEAGYAFGIGTKVIVVEMTNEPMSLMIANGRYATVKGIEGIKNYDWDNLPQTRTNTEQK